MEEALMRGYDVYAGVRSTSRRTYLTHKHIRFVELDFSSAEKLESKLLELQNEAVSFDYIIHSAGVTKAKSPDDFNTVNCGYTMNFAEALLRTRTVPRKFLYLSSLAAFGPADGEGQISNDSHPRPITSYGHSKWNAEKFLGSLRGFPHLIFRPSGVYGPRDTEFYFLYKLINMGIEPYLGSRSQQLSFIYVSDLTRVAMDALESDRINKSYFISDGSDYTIQSFNETIKRQLNKKTVKLVLPSALMMPVAYTLERIASLFGTVATFNRERIREFEAANWRCNTDAIKEDLNFSARYTLERGMKESIDWYKQQGWL